MAEINIDSILEASAKALEKHIEEDPLFIELRQAANNFLLRQEALGLSQFIGNKNNQQENISKRIKDHINKLNPTGGDTTIQSLKDAYELIKKKQVVRELYQSAFHLQNVANEILQQKVQMVQVFQDDENLTKDIEIYEINTEEYINFDSTSKGVSAKQRFNNEQLATMPKIEKPDSKEDQEEYQNLQALESAYKEILRRIKMSKSQFHKQGENILLYRVDEKDNEKDESFDETWTYSLNVNKGDLAETYAVIRLNQLYNYYPSDSSKKQEGEANINGKYYSAFLGRRIDHFIEWSKKVDNASGLLQGDTSKELKNNSSYKSIEYGVKTIGASAFKLTQVIEFALEILEGHITNKDEMENQKQQLKKDTNAEEGTGIRTKTEEFSLNTARKTIEKMIKKGERRNATDEQSIAGHKAKGVGKIIDNIKDLRNKGLI